MKSVKVILIFLTLSVMVTPVVTAEESKADFQVLPLPEEEGKIRNSVILLNNLAMAVEYWHDAWERGDGRRMAKHENDIFEIIDDDIQSTIFRKSDCDPKSEEFIILRDLLKVKNRLLESIKRGNTFGHRYRLLSDYQALMRKEVKQEVEKIAKQIEDDESEFKKSE